MSKLTIASAKLSTNGKSVMVNFQESSTRTTKLDSAMSAYQRASGMTAQTYVDDVVRYATERLSLEVAAANFRDLFTAEELAANTLKPFTGEALYASAVGKEVGGFHIQTYKSASPFYVVDGVAQKPAKSGMYFSGTLVLAELGDDVPEDAIVTLASSPELYRVVNAGVTVRGEAARDLMVAGGLASLTKATNIVEGATV